MIAATSPPRRPPAPGAQVARRPALDEESRNARGEEEVLPLGAGAGDYIEVPLHGSSRVTRSTSWISRSGVEAGSDLLLRAASATLTAQRGRADDAGACTTRSSTRCSTAAVLPEYHRGGARHPRHGDRTRRGLQPKRLIQQIHRIDDAKATITARRLCMCERERRQARRGQGPFRRPVTFEVTDQTLRFSRVALASLSARLARQEQLRRRTPRNRHRCRTTRRPSRTSSATRLNLDPRARCSGSSASPRCRAYTRFRPDDMRGRTHRPPHHRSLCADRPCRPPNGIHVKHDDLWSCRRVTKLLRDVLMLDCIHRLVLYGEESLHAAKRVRWRGASLSRRSHPGTPSVCCATIPPGDRSPSSDGCWVGPYYPKRVKGSAVSPHSRPAGKDIRPTHHDHRRQAVGVDHPDGRIYKTPSGSIRFNRPPNLRRCRRLSARAGS